MRSDDSDQEISISLEDFITLTALENLLCKDLTELYAFLVEGVEVPEEALEHDLVLEVGEQGTECLRGQAVSMDE